MGWDSSRRPCVHPCEHPHFQNMNISDTSEPITGASLGDGKAAFGCGPDRIRTLFSIATYIFHKVITKQML